MGYACQSRKVVLSRTRSEDDLAIVARLLDASKDSDYFAYERENKWHLGIGSRASLFVDPTGTSVTTMTNESISEPVTDSIAAMARHFVAKYSSNGSRVFGQAGFNYAAFTRGLAFTPGKWPLLSLMVPSVEVTVSSDCVTVSGDDAERIEHAVKLIAGGPGAPQAQRQMEVDLDSARDEYIDRVRRGISEIKAGKYKKVILSRAIDLGEEVDMVGTLVRGRRRNTPKRSFSVNHAGFQATGFSPELVMALQDGKIVTEPLAGTRAHTGSAAERKALKRNLESDAKEIVEHVISVKEAIEEVRRFSTEGSTVVEDFMTTRVLGHVQHLGSRVTGCLEQGQDGWDAFDVLFPSITASGIPKQDSLDAIERLETRPRELYSGAILMIDDAGLFEASLVLRTVFQNGSQRWVQAGAGVIEMSTPERELLETCEKLATIAPFVVAAEAVKPEGYCNGKE
ncbi:Salicylate synthase, partial [Metarhizium majus ARSEF 297]